MFLIAGVTVTSETVHDIAVKLMYANPINGFTEHNLLYDGVQQPNPMRYQQSARFFVMVDQGSYDAYIATGTASVVVMSGIKVIKKVDDGVFGLLSVEMKEAIGKLPPPTYADHGSRRPEWSPFPPPRY